MSEAQSPPPAPRYEPRPLVRGGTLGVALLLLVALAVMVNYLGWKYHHRFDWTGEQLYSLSDKTGNVLAGLDRDVEAVVLLQPGGGGGFDAYEATRELLSRYEQASPHVHVRFLDPARDPVEAQRVVDEYALDATAAVVFVVGDQRRVVSSSDLLEFDFSGLQMGQSEEVSGFRGEQRFTQAIVDLTEGHKPRVLFTTGHGEIPLDGGAEAAGRERISVARRLLGDDNFELEEWASLGAAAVPEGTDLVVVAGPTASFLAPELVAFGAYLDRGGRMLLLLDPPIAGGAVVSTGLEDWLAGYGVRVDADVVVDPAGQLPFYGPETFFASSYPSSHPVTRSLARGPLPLLVSLTRSVGRGTVPAGLEADVLVETSSGGWGETDLATSPSTRGGDDVQGPVPLAVAVSATDAGAASEDGEGEGADGAAKDAGRGGLRLVVFGDSSFASDRLIDANYANQALVTDVFNWLVEREGMIGLPAKRPEQVRLTLSGDQVRWLYLLALILLPGLAVALGVYVWYRRRR